MCLHIFKHQLKSLDIRCLISQQCLGIEVMTALHQLLHLKCSVICDRASNKLSDLFESLLLSIMYTLE
jgi:hypothetical protein